MTVNIPLLRKGVEWVEEQAQKPEIDREWDQENWRVSSSNRGGMLILQERMSGFLNKYHRKMVTEHCGTAFCFAGYIGQLIEPRYAKSQYVNDVHVSEFAAEQLGIEFNRLLGPGSDHLFYANNSAADIRRIAEELAGEPL